MHNLYQLHRRSFLSRAAAAGAALGAHSVFAGDLFAAEPQRKSDNKICAFVKFLQTLSYEELAERIAEMGFDGIEATVRNGGHVLPERVEEDLPKLVAALKKHDLEITVMASSVARVDEPHSEKVLRTASALGVKRYRHAGYRYDLKRPVVDQLAELKPVVKELVALGDELGMSCVYQNHSGERYVGAGLWDLHQLIKGYKPQQIGVAFDIRHATVEGGLSWPVMFNLMRPHFGAVFVKDFVWDGKKPKNVPLGEGRVDERFFAMLRQSQYEGPISLHIEYLHNDGVEKNVAALRTDLQKLRGLLG